MTDIPFSPGGFIQSASPESDLVPVQLKSGELIGVPHLVRAWLGSGLPLEEWLQRRERGGVNGDPS